MASDVILVVEDEPKIARQVHDYLVKSGFRALVTGDGKTALEMARHERPDLVVLDLNLPGMDGLDVCRALRRTSDVPIIMLTARVELEDRLVGLELGADDYITKPFSPREVVARVRVLLRRVHGDVVDANTIRVGELEIDVKGRQVTFSGKPVSLTRTEFNLLLVFASHPGQVFSRDLLLECLHDVRYEGFDRSIDAHVKNLRRKLEPDPANPTYFLTVYGVGYRFVTARELGESESAP